MRLPRASCVDADETVEQPALLAEGAVQRLRLGLVLAPLATFITAPGLTLLTVLEQLRHLLRFEDSGDADEIPLLRAARGGERTVLLAVEQRLLEGGDRGERLPLKLVGELRGAVLRA